MSDSPSNFVSWADYLGANQEQADAMAKKLSSGFSDRANKLGAQQTSFANEAGRNGQLGLDAYSGGNQGSYQNELMSYGEAVERLRDPATRQAVMQKQFGSASAIDSAMVGSGDNFAGAEAEKSRVMSGDAAMRDSVDQHYKAGQKYEADWKAGQGKDADRRQANYDAALTQNRESRERMLRFRTREQVNGETGIDSFGNRWDPTHDNATRSSWDTFGGVSTPAATPAQEQSAYDNQGFYRAHKNDNRGYWGT